MPRPTRNILVTLTGLSLLAIVSQTVLADVYKYTDAQGKVQYTDKPKTLPAERIGLQSRPTDDSAVQEREEAERKRMQEANEQRRSARTDASPSNAAPPKDKAQVCNQAREQYAKYMSTQRMYESLPNGERRYLNDEELDKARATAKTAMDTLCK